MNFDIAEGLETTSADHILDEIKEKISTADVVICDITGTNPNVMFEFGIAQGSMNTCFMFMNTSEQAARTVIPSDVQGFQRKNYANRLELEDQLVGCARAIIRERAEAEKNASGDNDEDHRGIAEEASEQLNALCDTVHGALATFDYNAPIGDLEDRTGLDRRVLLAILKYMEDENRVGRTGEGSGTGYFEIGE